MKRQNRALIFVFMFVFMVLFIVLQKNGEFGNKPSAGGPTVAENSEQLNQEALGEPIAKNEEAKHNQEIIKNLTANLGSIAQCLGLKNISKVSDANVNSENIASYFVGDWGQPGQIGDRSLTWSLHMPDGHERRIRLEISEQDEHGLQKELKFFVVNNEGTPISVDVPEDKRMNPSDQTIDQLLKEDEIFKKERLSFVKFSNGGLLKLLDRDNSLIEVSLQSQEKIIRCPNIKGSEPCDCGNL